MNRVLRKEILRDDKAHSYLICGNGEFLEEEVSDFIMALNCQSSDNGYPCGECRHCKEFKAGNFNDFILLEPGSGSNYSKSRSFDIEKLRAVVKDVSLSVPDGIRRVIWIKDPDIFRDDQYNTLLKSLEEPTPGVYFVLSTRRMSLLAQTITSRCRVLRLPNMITEDTSYIEEVSDFLTRIPSMSVEELFTEAAKYSDAEKASRFFEAAATGLGDAWINYDESQKQGPASVYSRDVISELWHWALSAEIILSRPIKKETIMENFLLLAKGNGAYNGNCCWSTLL